MDTGQSVMLVDTRFLRKLRYRNTVSRVPCLGNRAQPAAHYPFPARIRQGCESEMGRPHAPAGGPLSPVLAGRALLYHQRPARSLCRWLDSGTWRSVPSVLPDNRNGITDHALRRVTAASSPQMNAPAGKASPIKQESGQTRTPRQHRSPSFPHGFLRRKALH